MCDVLRCGNLASCVINVAPAGSGRIDAAVCEEHQSQIDQGAPWRYLYEDRRLLMGQDVPSRVVRATAKGLVSPDGTTSLFTFVIEDQDGDQREVDFELPSEIAEGVWRVASQDRRDS